MSEEEIDYSDIPDLADDEAFWAAARIGELEAEVRRLEDAASQYDRAIAEWFKEARRMRDALLAMQRCIGKPVTNTERSLLVLIEDALEGESDEP